MMQIKQKDPSSWVVVKFGGTSVSSRRCWENIVSILKDHVSKNKKIIVVCSAPSGVSNLLEKLLKEAVRGNADYVLLELQEKYFHLIDELQVSSQNYVLNQFQKLKSLVEGIRLVDEITPRVHARVMAFGECLLTHIGCDYLNKQGLKTHWQDVREWLFAENHCDFRHPDAYLSARCSSEVNIDLQKKIQAIDESIIITQGFIAQNDRGETVLLGRGGSDSSATYLAAKIDAGHCEIWTDVPGIYTANPKHIPQARLITRLSYDEAQELASMGAKVLHPKCIFPVSRQNIPLLIRYTLEPTRMGTEISHNPSSDISQIKSVLTKHDIVLMSIETVQMWHQVGFLAEVFQCFKKHGISIDLISTSESSVTVSLDKNSNTKESRILDGLIADLNCFSKVTVIAPCASVSLVGRHIRAILPQLGSVFSVFEEQKIHLVSQAANDLNLTFVVDEEQAQRLASKLHHLLIEQTHAQNTFHLSWAEEFGELMEGGETASPPWWQISKKQLLEQSQYTSPCYVYSKTCIQSRVQGLLKCSAIDRIYYSIKANNNADILTLFYQLGIGFECVSLEELKFILTTFPTIDRKRISFTPNFAPKEEYQAALHENVTVTIDNLYVLKHWSFLFSGKSIFIRIDSGEGMGHHKFVVTGGDQSKFGIPLADLAEVSRIVHENNIRVVGLHSHSGSGILQENHWSGVFQSLVKQRSLFPDAMVINVGGGLGIVEHPGQNALDLKRLNDSLMKVKSAHPELQIWMEPGRYLVAESGVLLAKVTQTKQKGDLQFVGIETGMNSLIRPMLYGSYHEIVNLTRLTEPKTAYVNIVGPICESGDTLGYSRWMPRCQEGDVILIANVGAYGRSMGSFYNLRSPAQEVCIL